MDVTPQLLHDVEFREAKRGGYNTQDVDEFLERLAVGIERQDAQLREARQRLEAAEARAATVDQRVAQAERRAVESSDTDDTLKRTLVLAQRTADAAIREAEELAAQTVAAAEEQSARMLADAQEATARARAEADREARQAQQEARDRALAELHELETARDQLEHDVDALEVHLAEQRDRVRFTTRELQRLLDDPSALREVPLPAVSDISVPRLFDAEAEAPEPIGDEDESVDYEDDAEPWTPDDEAWSEPEPVAPSPRREVPLAAEDGPAADAADLYRRRDAGDDAYLAELRKAMTDETPLGPRDESGEESLIDGRADAGRSRFGRRR